MSVGQETIDQEIVIFRCKGNFDPDYFKRFETNVLKALDEGARKFILNWKEVKTLSPSGFGLLKLLVELIHNKNSAVVFCSVSPEISYTLTAESGESVFFIYADESEAFESFKGEN